MKNKMCFFFVFTRSAISKQLAAIVLQLRKEESRVCIEKEAAAFIKPNGAVSAKT
jgi:hypothetical protein